MIGSFWNLCRACPSMPVDKLHSEYRSTYRWHEYTGPRQEVVRRPPLAASGGNTSKLQHTKSADEEPSDGGNIGNCDQRPNREDGADEGNWPSALLIKGELNRKCDCSERECQTHEL
ncbi:Uncharacterized protein GBIM_00943 [Gryllus bimaculatus]|nr:Uncharacterized protein GBIM_00943 [Gryllus bimaculatus]